MQTIEAAVLRMGLMLAAIEDDYHPPAIAFEKPSTSHSLATADNGFRKTFIFNGLRSLTSVARRLLYDYSVPCESG